MRHEISYRTAVCFATQYDLNLRPTKVSLFTNKGDF